MLTYRHKKAAQSTVKLTDCSTDEQFIQLWLGGKTGNTIAAYRQDIAQFKTFVENRPLTHLTIDDVAGFASALEQQGYAPSSIHRRLYAVKSLLSFGQACGYLMDNVGGLIELAPEPKKLSERILTEEEVLLLIYSEPNPRYKLMLRFLYETGCRLSEMCNLKWKDLKKRTPGGQVDILGKVSKVRHILISEELWFDLVSTRKKAPSTMPVFPTKSGRHYAASNVVRIVRAAAIRAGLEQKVSPHWLRHAHASHSLDRGAPLHLVQATLGHSSISTTERYLHARPDDSSSRYLPKT